MESKKEAMLKRLAERNSARQKKLSEKKNKSLTNKEKLKEEFDVSITNLRSLIYQLENKFKNNETKENEILTNENENLVKSIQNGVQKASEVLSDINRLCFSKEVAILNSKFLQIHKDFDKLRSRISTQKFHLHLETKKTNDYTDFISSENEREIIADRDVDAQHSPKTTSPLEFVKWDERKRIIKDKCHELIRFSRETLTKQDVIIENVSECEIYLNANVSTLSCKNVLSSSIYCGVISFSAYIQDCSLTNFTFVCHQARIDTCFNCLFNVAVSTVVVIEDSEGLKFGKNTHSYDSYEEDLKSSQLKVDFDKEVEVEDFSAFFTSSDSCNWTHV